MVAAAGLLLGLGLSQVSDIKPTQPDTKAFPTGAVFHTFLRFFQTSNFRKPPGQSEIFIKYYLDTGWTPEI